MFGYSKENITHVIEEFIVQLKFQLNMSFDCLRIYIQIFRHRDFEISYRAASEHSEFDSFVLFLTFVYAIVLNWYGKTAVSLPSNLCCNHLFCCMLVSEMDHAYLPLFSSLQMLKNISRIAHRIF